MINNYSIGERVYFIDKIKHVIFEGKVTAIHITEDSLIYSVKVEINAVASTTFDGITEDRMYEKLECCYNDLRSKIEELYPLVEGTEIARND